MVLGAIAIVIAAVMLGFSTMHGGAHGPARRSRNRRGAGREPDVGHDVCSLSQGVPERDESALVRDGVYGGRAGNGVGADLALDGGLHSALSSCSRCRACCSGCSWAGLCG